MGNYLFLAGGTGLTVGKAYFIMHDTMRMYDKDDIRYNKSVQVIAENMDNSNDEQTDIVNITRWNNDPDYLNVKNEEPHNFKVLNLSQRVFDFLDVRGSTHELKELTSRWLIQSRILKKEELELNLDGGYFRDLVVASALSDVVVYVAREEEDKFGISKIVSEVRTNSATGQIVKVVITGSGWGGEGRSTICHLPSKLKKACIEELKNDGKSEKEATDLVEKVLRIAVVMVGAAFKAPQMDNLENNVNKLVKDSLSNYPKSSGEALSAFYLLENDNAPIQMDEKSDHGKQFKHANAIELLASCAIDHFFNLPDDYVFTKKRTHNRSICSTVFIPAYSLPGYSTTTWQNLNLGGNYQVALSARLRFDAFLAYYLLTQIDVDDNDLYNSRFLSIMYDAKSSKAVKNAISQNNHADATKIKSYFRALVNRELSFLKWLEEISKTGYDWYSKQEPDEDKKAKLFDTKIIHDMIKYFETKNDKYLPIPNDFYTTYNYDLLTEIDGNNLFHTDNLTTDKVINKVFYVSTFLGFKKNKQTKNLEFWECLDLIYNVLKQQ